MVQRAKNLSWLQRWKGAWVPAFGLGDSVVVSGESGYTVAGYDYANRRYRVLRTAPQRSDIMVAESAVTLP